MHEKKLVSWKTEVDKLDIDKLAPVPVDLSKLSEIVKNDVVEKAVYEKLVAKVNNIDTSHFVSKIKYQTDNKELEKKFLMWMILLRKQNPLNYKTKFLM